MYIYIYTYMYICTYMCIYGYMIYLIYDIFICVYPHTQESVINIELIPINTGTALQIFEHDVFWSGSTVICSCSWHPGRSGVSPFNMPLLAGFLQFDRGYAKIWHHWSIMNLQFAFVWNYQPEGIDGKNNHKSFRESSGKTSLWWLDSIMICESKYAPCKK